MRFENEVRNLISEALKSLYNLDTPAGDILLQETKKEFVGDITLVVFPYTKASRKSPEITADEIGAFILDKSLMISSFNVVKGFLNLVLAESLWLDFFSKVSSDPQSLFDPTRAFSKEPIRKSLMVEYSSPNTNKPLHLGHIRLHSSSCLTMPSSTTVA